MNTIKVFISVNDLKDYVKGKSIVACLVKRDALNTNNSQLIELTADIDCIEKVNNGFVIIKSKNEDKFISLAPNITINFGDVKDCDNVAERIQEILSEQISKSAYKYY